MTKRETTAVGETGSVRKLMAQLANWRYRRMRSSSGHKRHRTKLVLVNATASAQPGYKSPAALTAGRAGREH